MTKTEAINEAIDQCVYLVTLKQKLTLNGAPHTVSQDQSL